MRLEILDGFLFVAFDAGLPPVAKVMGSLSAEWRGCSEGQIRDADDSDQDGVRHIEDQCPDTNLGVDFETTLGSPRRGCSDNQTPL